MTIRFGNHGEEFQEKLWWLRLVVSVWRLEKFCLKYKGSLHWPSESGWRVACFREALKSMLSQQDGDWSSDSCPWSITAELQNRSSLWGSLPNCFYFCIIQDKDCLWLLNCIRRRRIEKSLHTFILLTSEITHFLCVCALLRVYYRLINYWPSPVSPVCLPLDPFASSPQFEKP